MPGKCADVPGAILDMVVSKKKGKKEPYGELHLKGRHFYCFHKWRFLLQI